MGVATNSLEFWGRSSAVAEHYPHVAPADPPAGSGAVRAWTAQIQPFPSGCDVSHIVSDLDQDALVYVSDGNLLHDPDCGRRHTALGSQDRLVRMDVTFEVLALEFAQRRHPQAYCLSPEISRVNFPWHPHLRDDLGIWVKRFLPALCIYFAPDNVYDDAQDRLVQFFDFASIWLAKHLVWMRTLNTVDLRTGEIIYRPPDSAASVDLIGPRWPAGINPDLQTCFRTNLQARNYGAVGTWIGSYRSHDKMVTLSTVSPEQECWCGVGKPYGSCHRHSDVLMARERGGMF